MSAIDFKTYLEECDAQKKINKLARIYKNKKIVLYGAGSFCQAIFDNYNLSNLNFVAVADIKFDSTKNNLFYGIKCINPKDLAHFSCDVILIANYDCSAILTKLDDEILYLTKNENIEIRPLIKPSFKDLFL